MSGATGVMIVILLETAVGGLVVLWLSGVWGKVRRGYFLLAGAPWADSTTAPPAATTPAMYHQALMTM